VPAHDRLPAPLRRCVDQTIAAEALEGWRPTAEQVDALAALVTADVTYSDYLAAYLTRHPPPNRETTRRRLRRGKPYLIPGTTVLRNNFGADTHAMLADLEFVATAGRIAGWHRRIVDGRVDVDDVDFRAVHRDLFADAYMWAGDYRITDLRLADDMFARQSSVESLMGRVEAFARAMVADDPRSLADKLARLYADYNSVHPFREGNGRTGTTVLHIVASLHGARLDLSRFSRDEWYAASHDSMPARPDGSADHRPFARLLIRALA
jgi:cell filamentation protein, protein adenylyltransferase